MIELIFAIVIMGIVLMSAPMMIGSATKSSTVAFQQESIAIAAAHTAALMTYAWDEQNTDGRSNAVLCTNSSVAAFACNNSADGTRIRKVANNPAYNIMASPANTFGHIDLDVGTNRPETIPDDVDDFENNTTTLTIANTSPAVTDEGDYMDKNISIATRVSYAGDVPSDANLTTCSGGNGCAYSNPAPSGGTITNVKLIQTTLSSTNPVLGDKNIVLNAFMCNIGVPPVASQGGY
jgi:hypothetical protein